MPDNQIVHYCQKCLAANPLGQKIFDAKQPQLEYTVDKGKPATFHYRITISSHAVTVDEMNKASEAFEAEVR